MGPVTIAVDSYGPVTDNAQSVYELSLIEEQPERRRRSQKARLRRHPDFEHAKLLLEENDGAGNTFKATAKPVLIGTAVVGATTLIFSIIMLLTNGLTTPRPSEQAVDPARPVPAGPDRRRRGHLLVQRSQHAGGHHRRVSRRRVHQAEHEAGRAATKASIEDSKKVVAICTRYAQAGMFNIFLTIFFITLAAAFVDEYFFIGYLIGIALSGLFQAIFMANAGGAWDNAKKIVETELRAKGRRCTKRRSSATPSATRSRTPVRWP
jgi:K(+)-stimulated pyrophosphate-energized sodium pump